MPTLRDRIQEDMKAAMRAKEKVRLGVIRLILAAVKQREVDERITLDQDKQILSIIGKMIKQRRDAIKQYDSAGRDDLAAVEKREIDILQDYMPAQMDITEIEAAVTEIIATTGAKDPADMGKVMATAKDKLAGRADMGKVSQLVKSKLRPH